MKNVLDINTIGDYLELRKIEVLNPLEAIKLSHRGIRKYGFE